MSMSALNNLLDLFGTSLFHVGHIVKNFYSLLGGGGEELQLDLNSGWTETNMSMMNMAYLLSTFACLT